MEFLPYLVHGFTFIPDPYYSKNLTELELLVAHRAIFHDLSLVLFIDHFHNLDYNNLSLINPGPTLEVKLLGQSYTNSPGRNLSVLFLSNYTAI